MVQMTFVSDDVHFLLKSENIGITTEVLSPLFTLLKGNQNCYFPEDWRQKQKLSYKKFQIKSQLPLPPELMSIYK